MHHERQLELLDRIGAAGPRLNGLFGAASMVQQAAAYTDKDRFGGVPVAVVRHELRLASRGGGGRLRSHLRPRQRPRVN